MQYKVSVIIPIHNVEKYLKEAIESVLFQTLDFKKYIQLILIDDGSNDLSGDICKKYAEEYPKNVIFHCFPTSKGVSAARNYGLNLAAGQYVTFLDADDKWTIDAFENATAFLDMHQQEIDLVSANIEYFEAQQGSHRLNIDCDKDRIIDIREEHQCLRPLASACVIRVDAARKVAFDEKMRCWEDTKYINQLILHKCKYGILAKPRYMYRRRSENNSVSQNYMNIKCFYLSDFRSFYVDLQAASLRETGEILPMVQYLFCYAVCSRLYSRENILSSEEKKEYYKILKSIMRVVDSKIVRESSLWDAVIKSVLLLLKSGENYQEGMEAVLENKFALEYAWNRCNVLKNNQAIFQKWLSLKQEGKKLSEYFHENDYRRIAIYGMSDLGTSLLEELKYDNIEVAYGIDKRAELLNSEIPLYHPEADLPDVDIVIITAISFYDEIVALLGKKLEVPMISIEDVLFTI